jgi:DNA-binding LytR/AlgR family response regulator
MKKILLIEDESDILANMQYILEAKGYKVLTAFDGLAGFDIARREIPDLILSDIMMSGYNGYELKEKLDANKKTKSIPFVFLTAKTDMQDLRLGMNLGADDYLIKPVKTEELLKSIEARLKRIAQLDKGKKKSSGKNKTVKTNRILVNYNKKQIIIKLEEIKYILAEGLYTRIMTRDDKKFMLRKLLKDWEEVLPEENFFRIHRSIIINLECVEKVEKWFSRTYKVYLHGIEKPFDISQRLSVKLKERLSI